MKFKLKKNYHIARPVNLKKVETMIRIYENTYPAPKYMLFVREAIKAGFQTKLYQAGVSKYVFLKKGDYLTKVRFSNHKPNFWREAQEDCDYYVGISNFQVSDWQATLQKIKEEYQKNHKVVCLKCGRFKNQGEKLCQCEIEAATEILEKEEGLNIIGRVKIDL